MATVAINTKTIRQNTNWTQIAHRVIHYMKKEGAIKRGDETPNYLTVEQIAKECGFAIADWLMVKRAMLVLRANLAYTPSKGHYLGQKGDEFKNIYYAYRHVVGWGHRMKEWMEVIDEDVIEAGFNKVKNTHSDLDLNEMKNVYKGD